MKTLHTTLMAMGIAAFANAQNPDFIKLAEYAAQAPSGHNTQPWLFEFTYDAITIHPNFDRSLPVVDGSHRELYISLGCALENMRIAARQLGYRSETSIAPTDGTISVRLTKTEPQTETLFNAISKRQTNRNVYYDSIIPQPTIDQLAALQSANGIGMQFIAKRDPRFELLTNYVMQGNTVQMNDKAFKDELLSWIRLNNREGRRSGTGLTYKVMGAPATPRCVGKAIVRMYLNPKAQNKADRERIMSSSHFVMITAPGNTIADWIHTGELLEQFLLTATNLGVSCAFVNQPCETKGVSDNLQRTMLAPSEQLMLLLRIGYAPAAAYSIRQPINNAIVNSNRSE